MVIINEETFEEKSQLRISRFSVFFGVFLFLVLFCTGFFMMISYTSLKEYIPGYDSSELRQKAIQNLFTTDSLITLYNQNIQYLNSVRAVISEDISFQDEELSNDQLLNSLEQNTNFVDCKFNEGSSFRSATFEMADFRSANFEGHNNFEKARFTIVVRFEYARFSSSVCFNEAEFYASVNFNLAAAPVPVVPLYFNGAKFTKSPPYFFGREMHEDTDWTDVELPSAKLQAVQPRWRLEYDKRAYEQLRIKCGALGKVEDENLFFRREMDLTGCLSPWYTRVTYWLYHLVSDYGHSYWRPIVGLAGVWALWSGLYALYFMSLDKLHLGMDRMDLALSITGLSFANIFAVFGFHRRFPSDLLADPGTGAILLTASETLLGFVFLFFLGLGLRTRFRLR